MKRGLGLAGVAGGLLWVGVILVDPENENLRNRAWTVALLGMFLGFGVCSPPCNHRSAGWQWVRSSSC